MPQPHRVPAIFGTLLLLVSITSGACADEPARSARRAPGSFRLLTWNVQMLPTLPDVAPLRKKQALRAPWIVEYLNAEDYDVVVLQEVIDKKMTALLKAGLQARYPHVIAADAKRGFSGTSGGILFASKLPLKYVAHIVFKNISGVDGMAEKGCVLVEAQIDGQRCQIAGTHLQAGDDKMRDLEFAEIEEGILKPHAIEGVGQLLVGDMNVDVAEPEYQLLLKTTEMREFPLDDPRPFTTDGLNSWNSPKKKPKRIDHVLLNARGTHTTVTRQTVQRAKREHDGRPMDLADHYGVVAEIELQK